MNVLIIEDEAPAFRRLEKILLEIDPSIKIVEVLDSVEDAVKWFKNHHCPDIALMDIQISDGISFQIFDQIDVPCPVVFTTAFDEYLMKAFKVNSIDYLLKPIKKEELEAALEKYKRLHPSPKPEQDLSEILRQITLSEQQFKSRFLVKIGEKMLSIKAHEIVCFQSRHGIVHIITDSGKKYISDFTLDELGTQLDPLQFFRANRQYIVNADYIETVHKYFKGKLLVDIKHFSEEEIVVSTEKASSFKEWLDT